MTLDDYKSVIAIDDMSELADNLLQLGRTLGKADNFTAVSYTHLDVYKRQDLYLPGQRRSLPSTVHRQTSLRDFDWVKVW